MNILFISRDLGAIAIACRLIEEGHNLKFYDREPSWKNKIKRPGLIFVDNWKKELSWVGKKNGLIVFDDMGMGKTQDRLRAEGYSVFGGSAVGEKLEKNRQYGQKIFSAMGIQIKHSVDFYSIDSVIEFIKKHPKKWVLKQNGSMDKGLNYAGDLNSGEDVISVLKAYKKNLKTGKVHFDLQEKIEGVEIAVGRFFNGKKWIGPICVNIEHKNLFNDNLGPKTYEMGNLMWYDYNEKNRLFRETLGKMEKYLAKINYHGYFDINCIVDEENAYPLEATSRLGQPTLQLQDTLHLSQWGDFMKAIADGKSYNLKCKRSYGIIVFIGTPPYPYKNRSNYNSPKGLPIFFKEKLSSEEKKRIYLEEISFIKNGSKEPRPIICGSTGYVAFVSGTGKTVNEARKSAYALINKIVVPKGFYRTDIGLSFIQKNGRKLKKWGWI